MKWEGRGRIKEKRVLRIETKRALLLGTLIFIVAEVCARFLQSHTLSTLASPSFTIPATSLETTIFPRFRVPPKLSFHGMKRRIFFALCTSSPSSFLPKLPTKWRVETSLSSRPCLLPSLRLRNLFTSSFLLAPFTATAGKPRNKSRHRFFPPSNDSLHR